MTFAQFVGSGSTGIIGAINTVIVPLIFGLAFAYFIWGVVKYFFINGGDERSRIEGRQFVLWGVLAMALIFSIWGVLNILLSTLGIAP
ncbi:MAG TPA: hypothetical protein VMV50_03155 [Candidatus Paceibacterota bacterium]|nr:hypothetical protein [Candidatus Paceibacterota bacterium]